MSGDYPEKRSYLHSASDSDSDVDLQVGSADIGLANQLGSGSYGDRKKNSYVTHDFKVFRAVKVDPDRNEFVGDSSLVLNKMPREEGEVEGTSERPIEASDELFQGRPSRSIYRPHKSIFQSETSHNDLRGGEDTRIESVTKETSSETSPLGDNSLGVTETNRSILSELETWPTLLSPFSGISIHEADNLGADTKVNGSSENKFTAEFSPSEIRTVARELGGRISPTTDAEEQALKQSAFYDIPLSREDGGRPSVPGSDIPLSLGNSLFPDIDALAEQVHMEHIHRNSLNARPSQVLFPLEIDLLGDEISGTNSYRNSNSETQSSQKNSVVEMETFGELGGLRIGQTFYGNETSSLSYRDSVRDEGEKGSSVGNGMSQLLTNSPVLDFKTPAQVYVRHGNLGSSSDRRSLPEPKLVDTDLQREHIDTVVNDVTNAESLKEVKEPLLRESRTGPLTERKRVSVTYERKASHVFAASNVQGDEAGGKNASPSRGTESRSSGKEPVVDDQAGPSRDFRRTSLVFGGDESRPLLKELAQDEHSQHLRETISAPNVSVGHEPWLSGHDRSPDKQSEPLRDARRGSVISGRRLSRLPSTSDRDPESVPQGIEGRGSVNQSNRRASRMVSPPPEAESDVQTRERDEYGVAGIPEFIPRQSSLQRRNSIAAQVGERVPPEWALLLLGCLLGLSTGLSVVLFNKGVFFIHDMAWAGTPNDGAAWFRLQQLIDIWHRVLLLPVVGGVVVGMMHAVLGILDQIKASRPPQPRHTIDWLAGVKPTIKAGQAMVTLGTGCSLGPEGPSVDIGKAWANGLATIMKNNKERRIALVAAGAAAGISAGFNAPVSGMFFAIETVLRPQNAENSPPLTTAMIILASVISSTISQIVLEETPAFTVPTYELRSAAELPLYLLLGGVCGVVSVIFVRMTAYFTELFEFLRDQIGVPPTVTPAIGGLVTGVIALKYPGVLYWGFYNVDEILHSGKSAIAPGAGLVTQLICAKVVATSFSKGSGLVGGVYAPSLFIGAAVGSVYGTIAGKIIDAALPGQDTVAHPQAYALVGMAALLAAVCSVPLTSILLLFELTKDYHILLPLMGGIGVAIWVAAVAKQTTEKHFATSAPFGGRSFQPLGTDEEGAHYRGHEQLIWRRIGSGQEVELCTLNDYHGPDVVSDAELKDSVKVSQAMSKTFVKVQAIATVKETIGRILAKQQRCAVVVDENDLLEGIFTFSDLEREVMRAAESSYRGHRALVDVDKMLVAGICSGKGENQGQDTDLVVCFPDMSLRSVLEIMDSSGFKQLPVVARAGKRWQDEGRHVVGLVDREAIPRSVREEASKRIAAILAKDDEDDDGPLLDVH